MLYYTQVILLFFCMYLFNDKLEWIILISSFYMTILFTYGLTSELYKAESENLHFITNSVLNPIGDAINIIPKKLKDYIGELNPKYLLILPAILHLSSIKLITNNEGNKKIRKSKSKTKQLNRVKIFISLTTILFAIITIFGFNPNDVFRLNVTKTAGLNVTKTIGLNVSISAMSIPILFIVSIVEIILAIIVYKSY